MLIDFISTESLEKVSGGWSGINYHLVNALKNKVKINYYGPINPPYNKLEHFVSRIQKSLHLPRNIAFFSKNRLVQIKQIVTGSLDNSADYNFFWGHMPWLSCNFEKPYAVYLDITIRKYLEVFQPKEHFREKELLRVEKSESEWLNNAAHVFWGSQWALDEAIKSIGINNENQHVVWLGGNMPIPSDIVYPKNLSFTFISLRFNEKGGYIAFDAFSRIYKKYPAATLTIIGEKPPVGILDHPGIKYAGYLRKNNEEELQKFIRILKNSFCLIHPTTMDTMGAVIIEAGYYGCPTIAPASFGIPELIISYETGIVLSVPFTVNDYVSAMLELIENPKEYEKMRDNVRNYCTSNFTYEIIADKIVAAICNE